jgi:hypothetical protein
VRADVGAAVAVVAISRAYHVTLDDKQNLS